MQFLMDFMSSVASSLISPLGIVCILALLAFFVTRAKASKFYASHGREVHSLPFYNAAYVFLAILLPAIIVLIIYSLAAPTIYQSMIESKYQSHLATLSDFEQKNFINNVFALTYGNITSKTSETITQASAYLKSLTETGSYIKWLGALGLALLFGGQAYRSVSPRLRARNRRGNHCKNHSDYLFHHRHFNHHRHCVVSVV